MPRLRCLLFLLAVLTFSACGDDGGTERSVANFGSGDIRWSNFPVQIQVDPGLLTSSRSARDLHDAIAFWERKAGKRLFVLAGLWEHSHPPYTGLAVNPGDLLGNVIYIQPNWPYDPRIAGKTIVHSSRGRIEGSIVLINSDVHLCARECYGMEGSVSRRKLIAHELGHFLGLGHSSSIHDIMYPEILPGGALESLNVNEELLRRLTE